MVTPNEFFELSFRTVSLSGLYSSTIYQLNDGVVIIDLFVVIHSPRQSINLLFEMSPKREVEIRGLPMRYGRSRAAWHVGIRLVPWRLLL